MEKNKILLLACFLMTFSTTASIGYSEDLIPPTRTLQTDETERQAKGKITVASEPPGLPVFLDGIEIGRTPVWSKPIEPGSHKLRIADSETDIFATPETLLRVSLFEGSFIVEEVDSEKETDAERKPLPHERRPPPETVRCKYGHFESPPGSYKCYYGGWGTHVCTTNTGLKECKVSGGKAYSCEQLKNELQARDCCRNNYGGFSKSFTLEACDIN